MITVSMRGGLGNQMFQYAFGKACAARLQVLLFIDLSWYQTEESARKNRKFLLDEMKVSFEQPPKSRWPAKLLRWLRKPVILKDNSYFEKENLDVRANTILQGCWESPLYFSNIEEVIRREFVLKQPGEGFGGASKKIGENSISVHIRRGDILALPDKRVNGLDYCAKAVKYIVEKKNLKNPSVVVFSDDPAWCKQELKVLGGQPVEVFDEKLKSDVEELILMSLHGNNVIGNSTFSWWAAFLNKNPDKMVVMPSHWWSDPERNRKYRDGIHVPGWIIME